MPEENPGSSLLKRDSNSAGSPLQQLWEQWRQQHCPDFAAFPGGDRLTPEQVLSLLRFDQDHHWRTGRRIPAEAYLQRYRLLQESEELALVLIFSEFLLRRELGERPELDEYCWRFPAHAESLGQQLALNDAFLPEALTGTVEAPDLAVNPRKEAASALVPAGYELVGEIGRGGMGVVYKARQTALGRMVALKMLLAGAHAGAEQQRRFESEARAVAQLRHPNFVQIYDYGFQEGNAYLALEFIEGGTLAQKAAGRPQAPRDAAQLVETMAMAMHHAHRQSLIHRDLKPANVLLTSDGVLKITDFGLVKRLDEGALETKSGTIVGTASYMAPEQVLGNREATGPATDVYALGVILYELLTGQAPFQGENTLQVLQQVKEKEPLPPSRLQPRTPRNLETICLKCLQKEPARRYASAAALAEDLRRFRAGEPIAARPVGAMERTWRWCLRNPRWAAMLLVVAGLLLVIAVGASALSVGLSRALQQAERANRERQLKLFETYLEKARAMRNSRRVGQRFGTLQTIEQAVALARELGLSPARLRELSTEAIAALALTDLRIVREWTGRPEGTFAVDFDGPFERYARVGPGGIVSLRRIADDVELFSWQGFEPDAGKSFVEPLFSPDGNYLLLWTAPGPCKLWKIEASGPTLLRQDLTGPTLTHTFSTDSRRLAFSHPDGTIVSKKTRQLPPEPGASPIPYKGLAFHPDGRHIAVAARVRGQPAVRLRDLETSEVTATLMPPGAVGNLAWHPGGRLLAASGSQEIYLFDIEDGGLAKLEGTRNGGLQLAFNHGGDLLASCDWNGELRLWETHSAQLLFSTYAHFKSVRFSRDDHLLGGDVWSTQQLRTWEVPGRRAYYSLRRHAPAHGDIYVKPTVSPDGRWLAVGMYDGTRIWDLSTRHEQAHLSRTGRNLGLLFDAGNALWTYGSVGLLRWPIRTSDPPERCRIGPPQPLLYAGIDHSNLWGDRAGQIFAVPQSPVSVAIMAVNAPGRPVQQLADISSVCLSADGQWLALTTGDAAGHRVRVCDARSARVIKEWRTDKPLAVVGFSSDGRWLVFSESGGSNRWLRLWRTDSWEPGPALRGEMVAFSPDGTVLAVDTGEGGIRLLKPGADEEYAYLDDPQQNRQFPGGLAFTPDGCQLITVSNTGLPAVHIWDLHYIKEELARLGLDDNLPAGTPAWSEPASRQALPHWEVDMSSVPLAPAPALALYSAAIALQPFNPGAYYQRALAYTTLERYREALVDLQQAIDLHADWQMVRQMAARPSALNSLAWACVTGPAASRMARVAVTLAERAVALDELNANSLNTLGVAYYRDGDYRKATAVLEKSLHDGTPQYAAYDLYFLAMCHQRLGDAAQANQYFERARTSHQRNAATLAPTQAEELNRFRHEAEITLGRRYTSSGS